jgi:hypothetical protein
MKISSNVVSPIKYKFKDKKTGKNINFEIKSDEIQKIEKKVSNVKSYLQTMFTQYQKDGNIDKNSDGYLDAKELITSKRFINFNISLASFSIVSLQDKFKDDKLATQTIEGLLKYDGNLDGKISMKKDFLNYLAVDTNQDAVISDKEIFNGMQAIPLSAIFKKFILEQILAMIKKNKDKILNGISDGAFNSSAELEKKSKILDTLLKNNGDLNSLSDEEKSIFSSTKKSDNTINIIDLLGKQKSDTLKKYIDTQADNAKIFSLKV